MTWDKKRAKLGDRVKTNKEHNECSNDERNYDYGVIVEKTNVFNSGGEIVKVFVPKYRNGTRKTCGSGINTYWLELYEECDNVSSGQKIDLYEEDGEIHAICSENGEDKGTLVAGTTEVEVTIKPNPKPMVHRGKISIGDRFERIGGEYNGHIYVLARHVYGSVVLIDLDTGERWSEPQKVSDDKNITETEFERVVSNAGIDGFKKVSKTGEYKW